MHPCILRSCAGQLLLYVKMCMEIGLVLGSSDVTSSDVTSLATFLSSVGVASLFSESNTFSVAKFFY